MDQIEIILSRLRELPLVTSAETAPIPDEIAALFPAGALTFRAIIDDGEKYGKAETYVLKEIYEQPEAVDLIVDNVNQIFRKMAVGEQFAPDIDGPVLIEIPPNPYETNNETQ